MLFVNGDYVIDTHRSKISQVVCADDTVFVIGKVVMGDGGDCLRTKYKKLKAYAQDQKIVKHPFEKITIQQAFDFLNKVD